MANPVGFPEFNRSLGKPKDWDPTAHGDCDVLPVWTDGAVCISCWRLTPDELMEILQTGRIWIRVYSFRDTQPALMVHTENPFVTAPEEPEASGEGEPG
jgi:hypothetical protein